MEKEFEKWLRKNCNLSESSVNKYKRAIRAVSNDMMAEGVIHGSLYNISSWSKFESVKAAIITNNFFIDKDTKGHHMYSCALNNYGKFLRNIQ